MGRRLRLRHPLVAVVGGAAIAIAVGVACSPNSGLPQTVGSGGRTQVSGGGSPEGGAAAPDTGTITTSGGGTVLASGVFSPQNLALDSTNVYWTTSKGVSGAGTIGDAATGTGAIESVPRGGGAITDIIIGLSNPQDIAVASPTLFFSQGASGSSTLDAYTLGSVTITALVAPAPLPMVVYDSTLYWVGATGSGLELASAPTSIGTTSKIGSVSGPYSPIALVTNGGSLFVLATDASRDGYIFQSPLSGGTPTELWHASAAAPVGIAVSGDTVYWSIGSSSYGGEILSVGSEGGTVITLAENVDNPGQLGVSSGTVYFTSDTSGAAGGAVLSVPGGGGSITTLASGLDYPSCLVVDDAVYVGTATTITRVAF
jgi:hypothetical protein